MSECDIPDFRWSPHFAALMRATCCELICLPCKLDLDTPVRQINTTGKSLLIIRNHVKPGNRKYSAFVRAQITGITLPVSPD